MEYNEPSGIKVGENNPLRNGNMLKGLSYTLKASTARYVLVTPKSTSTQLKPTRSTSEDMKMIINPKLNNYKPSKVSVAITASSYKEPPLVIESEDTETMETQLRLTQQNSQTLTSWWEDFHAKLSPLLASELDLTTPEGHSFLTSHGFVQKKDPDIWYSKMLKVYLVTTTAKLSRQSLGFLPTWGISWNGRYLTAKTSEFPKTGSVCSLSDILEENPDEKYFLSSEQTAKILSSVEFSTQKLGGKDTNKSDDFTA